MVRVNLLPVRETLRNRQIKQFAMTAVGMVAVTFALMGITYFLLSMQVSGLKAELAAHQSNLDRLKKENEIINKLKEDLNRLDKQVQTINKLTKIRDTPDPFMWGIARAVPDSVWLKTMNKTDSAFHLEGVAMDNTVVVEFVDRLKRMGKMGTDEAPFQDEKRKDDAALFRDVKLIQTVRGAAGGGKDGPAGVMSFSVNGTVQK